MLTPKVVVFFLNILFIVIPPYLKKKNNEFVESETQKYSNTMPMKTNTPVSLAALIPRSIKNQIRTVPKYIGTLIE